MWNTYGADNVHIVFGATSQNSWTLLNTTYWRDYFTPSLTYWLSIADELGAHYGTFGNGYVPYNIIVGPGYQLYLTGAGFSESEATAAIDQAMANFDLYPVSMVPDQTIQAGEQTVVDISSVFYNNTGSAVSFSISENSNEALCSFTFDGTNMTITGNSSIGSANITLKAAAGTNESYIKFSVEVYDPNLSSLLAEGYENSWPPDGWTLETTGAGFIRSSNDSHSGMYTAAHMDNTGTQDDWLISPQIEITDGTILTFWEKGLYNSYYTNHEIGVSVDMRRFTNVYDGPAGDAWEKKYIDLSAFAGKSYYIGFYYQGDYSDVWYIDDIEILTPSGIEDVNIVQDIELFQNYPNPFNPSTSIKLSVDKDTELSLTVFNSLGEEVTKLHDGPLTKGVHEFKFSSENLNSGTYFYTLESMGHSVTRKMILVK